MHEVPVEDVKDLDLDVILFQARQHYEADQYEILSDRQRRRQNSNPFTLRLGAPFNIGMCTPNAPHPDRWMPYLLYQHEIARTLELVGLIGAQPPSWQPSFAVLEQDRVEAAAVLPDLRAPYAVLHPGASEESRRWPADRFVQVGNALAAQGWQIVVTGVEYEHALVERIAAELEHPAIPVVGRLSIGGLAALLKDAALVVSNDTGPMHLANAVGTPNVAIFWCGNYMNWAHFNRRGHRPLRSWTVICPLCGADMTPDEKPDTGCDHNACFVDGVTVEQVLTEAFDLLAYHAALPASAANRA